ncbi:hypothetical protein NDU88_010756 [Pleurodeles waltl]|uniref:Uncharacterized protein n=1 Tax=Pleurodeles waltl TaxID=8319 RepID=A0AAV7RZ42_PLEWA|nr:hypothetical protein NDU88_010756 [Pleurodeles waltl]
MHARAQRLLASQEGHENEALSCQRSQVLRLSAGACDQLLDLAALSQRAERRGQGQRVTQHSSCVRVSVQPGDLQGHCH